MELNKKNAVLRGLVSTPPSGETTCPIVHFGVGAFHRSHQAWALQRWLKHHADTAGHWGISGVCILPQDLAFTEKFRKQDCLYFVKRFAPDGKQQAELVTAIREILHVSTDYSHILQRIADPVTKVISFTITEGGYNVDYSTHSFIWETPAVQDDLQKNGHPKTVFRVLAEGLKKRREETGAPVILMSCDNVQHNGEILKLALLEFLKKFDPPLIEWVEQNVVFVKTMVDRITPVASEEQKQTFAQEQSMRDDCLVVCEEYFQWIIEKHLALEGLPFAEMGALLVDDVEPFEKMKLRLLNGGHSLTGLLGYALGYNTIHTAIRDEDILATFRHYCLQEVIPTLDPIKSISYPEYVQDLVERFGNPMINDSTARIISGSTDKLPKFVLPVIADQLAGKHPDIHAGVLILAAWYHYLQCEFEKNRMADVVDLQRDGLLALFGEPGWSADQFLDRVPMLQPVSKYRQVRNLFSFYVQQLRQKKIRMVINMLLHGEIRNEQ